MLYCSSCSVLCEDQCPLCGSKKLREPLENDPVYLITKDSICAGMVEELLQDNEIPYEKRSVFGCGVTLHTGTGIETYNFFVPYGAYKKSCRLLKELFPENDSDMNDSTEK